MSNEDNPRSNQPDAEAGAGSGGDDGPERPGRGSPSGPDPREQRKRARAARTRQAILDAAVQTITREGYVATTMEHIAQQTGYSVGALYNYFAGKDALLRALSCKALNDFIAILSRPLPASLDARQRLEVTVLRLLGGVHKSRAWMLPIAQDFPVTSALGTGYEHDELARLIKTLSDLLAQQVREAIGEGAARQLDPHLAGVFVANTIKGVVVDWLRRGAEQAPTHVAAAIVEFVFNGIGTHGATDSSPPVDGPDADETED